MKLYTADDIHPDPPAVTYSRRAAHEILGDGMTPQQIAELRGLSPIDRFRLLYDLMPPSTKEEFRRKCPSADRFFYNSLAILTKDDPIPMSYFLERAVKALEAKP